MMAKKPKQKFSDACLCARCPLGDTDKCPYGGTDYSKNALTTARQVIAVTLAGGQLRTMKPNTVYNLANALSGCAKAEIQRQKWVAEQRGITQQVNNELRKRIREVFSKDPELIDRMLAAFDDEGAGQSAGKLVSEG